MRRRMLAHSTIHYTVVLCNVYCVLFTATAGYLWWDGKMVDLSAIITDDEDDSKIIQGHVTLILMVHSRQAFHDGRRSFLLMREHQAAAVALLQQHWMSKRTHEKFCTLKKSLFALQACARHKYIWGVNDK